MSENTKDYKKIADDFYQSFLIMRDANEKLAGLVRVGFIVCAVCCVFSVIMGIGLTLGIKYNRNINAPQHPYNICLELLINESHYSKAPLDLDKIKSVCFELMNDKAKK